MIPFSDFFQLSASILFTLVFSLYFGTNIFLNNYGLIRGGGVREEIIGGNGTAKSMVLKLY